MIGILSVVPSVFDKLINLLKHRSDEHRHFFDTHIEPVFAQLLTVHDDYIASIDEVAEVLGDEQSPLLSLRHSLMKKKRLLEHLRQLVYDSIARLLKDPDLKPPDPDVEEMNVNTAAYLFASAVYTYFKFSTGDQDSPFSHYKGLLGVIDNAMTGKLPRRTASLQAKRLLDQLPRKWTAVSQAYVELKAQCHARR